MNLSHVYVLVVSPEWDRGNQWMEALTMAGYSAYACTSSMEALCAPRPDIVITDLELPDHDGLELLEALSAGAAPLASILAVDSAPLEVFQRAMRMGVRQLLGTNASENELLEIVQEQAESISKSGAPTGFEKSLASTATACEQVQRELSAWLLQRGVAPSTRCRVVTALGEALENACLHGYLDDIGTIDIDARIEGANLELFVRDRGEGTPEWNPISGSENDQASGIGRMRALSENCTVTSNANWGTQVCLTFSIHRTTFSEDECTDFEDFDFLVPDHSRRLLANVQDVNGPDVFHLSPAIAVTLGRLLCGVPADPAVTAKN